MYNTGHFPESKNAPQIIMHFRATSRALLSAARAHLVILFEMKPAESLKEAGLSLEHMAG